MVIDINHVPDKFSGFEELAVTGATAFEARDNKLLTFRIDGIEHTISVANLADLLTQATRRIEE